MRNLFVSVFLGLVLLALPASATHINGIKVTVSNLDPGLLSADVTVTGYVSGSSSMALGYSAVSPAVDFGDGNTISTTSIPFAAAGPTSATNGGNNTFRGVFSHTYPGAGPFTVRVASGSCCVGNYDSIITGIGHLRTGALAGTETYPIAFVTNTAVVDFSSVPAASRLGLFLLAGALLAAGAFLLLRR